MSDLILDTTERKYDYNNNYTKLLSRKDDGLWNIGLCIS